MALGAGPPAGADQLYTYDGDGFAVAQLPNGPGGARVPVGGGYVEMFTVGPSGRLFGLAFPDLPDGRVKLYELEPNAGLRLIGRVALLPGPHVDLDQPLDLAFTSSGRLFLLLRTYFDEFFGSPVNRLVEVDPETATTLGSRATPEIRSMARAGTGLWALTAAGLNRFDPDTGVFGNLVASREALPGFGDFDSGSGSTLYFLSQPVCSPPCPSILTYDVDTGASAPLPASLTQSTAFFTAIAIRPSESPTQDEIYMGGSFYLAHAPLPDGPPAPAVTTVDEIDDLLAVPDGRLLALGHTGDSPSLPTIGELVGDRLESPAVIRPADGSFVVDEVNGLAFDLRGRLFATARCHAAPPANGSFYALLEIDGYTGGILAHRVLEEPVYELASSPRGLYGTNAGHEVRELDPETGRLGFKVADLSLYPVGDLDADSAGRLYFKYEFPCSPPCPQLGRVDPATGIVEELPDSWHAQVPQMRGIAIARRCWESPLARCLQGGRFRVEARYSDYFYQTGAAKVAPARSRDTGIFSFFDPANWELMVKVLDGCVLNGQFWVYASASTDVGFEFTVTDTRTGAQKVYGNPLGQAARAITDSTAFSCTNVP